MPSKAAGTGDPGQFLGEDLARRVRVDERLDAHAGAGVSRIGERAEHNVEACRRLLHRSFREPCDLEKTPAGFHVDRKSTRLNSSHGYISYAVFCLKKK